MSGDGFVAGPNQSVENPLGIGGENLHEWVFPLRYWREMQGMAGGEVNASDQFLRDSHANIGATIMGRNMFGGHPGPWKASDPWNGWWGENPPYHRPVFVITHHPREPLRLEGGNTFHFVTDGIESAVWMRCAGLLTRLQIDAIVHQHDERIGPGEIRRADDGNGRVPFPDEAGRWWRGCHHTFNFTIVHVRLSQSN